MKDKLSFSELDIKETASYWRAKEGVFLNLSRYRAVILDMDLPCVWAQPSLSHSLKEKHRFKLGYELILDGAI